jgi:hypothetical protein
MQAVSLIKSAHPMADEDRLLKQIGKLIDSKLEPVHHGIVDVMQGQERIEKRLDNVEQG